MRGWLQLGVFVLLVNPGWVQAQHDEGYDSIRNALHALAERTGDRLLVRAAAQLARICTNSAIDQTPLALSCRVLREALLAGNQDQAIRFLVRGMMAEETTAIGRDLNYGIKALSMPLLQRMAYRQRSAGRGRANGGMGLAMGFRRWVGLEEGAGWYENSQGLFATLNYADTRRDSTSLEPGFTYDRFSYVLGLDRQLGDSVLLGLALSYRDERGAVISDLDQDSFGRDAGALDMTQAGLALYGSVQWSERWRFDALLSGALDRYYQSRLIEFHVLQRDGTFADYDGYAQASPNGRSQLLHLGLTHERAHGAWRMNLGLAWQYSQTRIGGYTERSARPEQPVPFLVAVGERNIVSSFLQAHVQIDRAISLSSGVLMPFVRLDHFHERALSAEKVPMFFIADPLALDHQVITEEPDRDYSTLQLGASLVLAGDRQIFFRISRLSGYRLMNETLYSLGGRWQF